MPAHSVSLPARERTRAPHSQPVATSSNRPRTRSKNRLIKVYRSSVSETVRARDDDNESDSQKDKSTKHEHKSTSTTHDHDKGVMAMTDIPNPTPDTGIQRSPLSIGYNPQHSSVISKTAHGTQTTSTFVPLPSLATAPPPAGSALPNTSTTARTSSSAAAQPSESSMQQSSQGSKLPVAAIAALAIGSAVLLFGLLIILKTACFRPTRRMRPKPSLPILDDDYGNKKFEFKEKESPVFGGKERFSSHNEGLWTQQHSANSLHDHLPTHATYAQLDDPMNHYTFPASQSNWQYQMMSSQDSRTQLLPPPSQSVPVLPTSHQPTRSNSLARAVSRFSAASLSLYPSSPISAQDIGIAISSSKAFTADGHPIMDRATKAALRRSRSELLDDQMELAYDGADVASPKVISSPSVPTTSIGRTRIKSSYYTPGSYPRISTIPSSTSSKLRGDDPYEYYPYPPMPKKETSALTSSVLMPSPQPTLYPDDSLSVVGARRPSKRLPTSKSQRGIDVSSSGVERRRSEVDTSTALGSLMLNMDFGATNRSLATLAGRLGENIAPTYGEFGTESSATLVSKVKLDSKPPRVPSPPPLPSLAQMGLEHSDPVGFADYRSPTYSICGLYEDERRSRTTSYFR